MLNGLAPNGGLYIPESIPSLPKNWQEEWANCSFQELSHAVLSLYIPESEISSKDLRSLIDRSYASFRHPDVTPVAKLREREFVLELFHGPTFAFKDVALQLLGNLFEFFLKRRNDGKVDDDSREKLTVIGATSGDTGRCVVSLRCMIVHDAYFQLNSAAIYGLRGKSDISIFILHPKNRVSPIQEAQMTTVTDANVHNIAVKGTFDDCQDIVKALFADTSFNETYHLGAVNSINWARILAQIVYYFSAYFQARKILVNISPVPQLQFVVPTGNFGDVLAGWYAKKMGLPMAKLVVATNENDILARFWATGRYEKQSTNDTTSQAQSGGVRATASPAMDILISSNFERLLWYLAMDSLENVDFVSEGLRRSKACSIVKGWMDSVKADGRAVVSTEALEAARKDFSASRVDDEQVSDFLVPYTRLCFGTHHSDLLPCCTDSCHDKRVF